MATGMIIDGVLGSEAIDSSGEVLDVEGADISDVDKGTLLLNWEHEPGEKGADTIVGKVVSATKIFKESDCQNDRQRMYWRQVKMPFIYGVCRLFDGAGHDQARAIAAIIRDNAANNEPLVCRYSVEGSTLDKKDNRLVESVIRRVAVTVKPCNRTANSGIIEDPNAPDGFEKKFVREKVKDLLEFETTEKFEHPLYMRLAGATDVECNPLMEDVAKAISAGQMGGAPGTLTGGAALQREDLRHKAAKAIQKYAAPEFKKDEFKAYLKQELPEASEEFLDHFMGVAEDYHVRRRMAKKEEGEVAEAPAPKTEKKAPKRAPAKAAAPEKKSAAPKKSKAPKADAEVPTTVDKPATPRLGGKPFPPVAAAPAKTNAALLATFNPDSGELKTSQGTFKASVEHDKAWGKILNEPGFVDMFDSIMNNLKIVGELRKNRVSVPGELSVAAMMGGYSSNEQVPVMEAAVGHTVDLMREHPEINIDKEPLKPEHEQKLEGKFQSQQLPKFGSGAGTEEDPNLWEKNRDTLYTKAGPVRKIGKPTDKIGTLQFYHRMHPLLDSLVKQHGDDGQTIANELIKKKAEWEHWKERQRAAYDTQINAWERKRKKELVGAGLDEKAVKEKLAQEKSGVRIDYGNWGRIDEKLQHAGPIIEYLSNKTLRYMVGMLGCQNVHVPDTHFTRHFFGLDLEKNKKEIGHLKDVLLDPANAHVLNQIDDYHRRNHPAAHWVRNRYFGGADDAQSTFPGFWAHWMNIPAHERATGKSDSPATNEASTHAPYFRFVAEQMRAHGIPGWEKFIYKAEQLGDVSGMPLEHRITSALTNVADKYGHHAAMLAYHMAMAPALVGGTHQQFKANEQRARVNRLQGLSVDLNHALGRLRGEQKDPDLAAFTPEVHSVDVKVGGNIHPAGRILVHNGRIRHLEDYHGLLQSILPEGPMNEDAASRMYAMSSNPHLVVRRDAPTQEHEDTATAPEAGPQQGAAPTPVRPPSIFHYQRVGMDRPHTLEVRGGAYLLDGNQLSPKEVHTILTNVRQGAGSLRYVSGGAAERVKKMETTITSLMKSMDDSDGSTRSDLQEAMAAIRANVAAGHLEEKHERTFTRWAYEDRLTPGIGNKGAAEDFLAKNKPGVYVQMDGNDFREINNTHGHRAGDHAIRVFGKYAREAMDEAVGRGPTGGKLFRNPEEQDVYRNGGDEFMAHVPSHEHAAKFARLLTQKLEAHPPIGGTHKLSMSFGFGLDHATADTALYKAKDAKYHEGSDVRKHPVGQTPSLIHSLVPGFEGAVPTADPGAGAVRHVMSMPEVSKQAKAAPAADHGTSTSAQ